MVIKSVVRDPFLIPKFNGNRKLPEAEQVKVEIKSFPTALEAQGYKQFKYDDAGAVELKYNDSYIILNCVGKISGLKIDPEGKIENGQQLSDSKCLGLKGLISEIRNYVLDDGGVIDTGENKA